MSKKTNAQLEQEIKDLKIQLDAKPEFSNIIEGSTFVGVKWDGKALRSVDTVARALEINAVALENLTRLFANQKIKMPAMVSINKDNVAVFNNVLNDTESNVR